ncbi:MAG: CDP-alcohol phosphatidyltransferase family protein [Desulfovermiculus sp.]|nr:CDP-alcohol phosphatidyltransferase family protein [Desulfovermiculus sp.]
MDLRESRLGRIYLSFLDKSIVHWLQRKGLRPNTVTVWGLAVACLVPVGFYLTPWAGFILIALSGIADSLDGFLARATQRQSAFGSFWDSTVDRAADCAYLVGFLILFWSFPQWRLAAAISLLLALLFTLLISYTKAKIESLGHKCRAGLMGRPLRTVYLLGWALLVAIAPGVQLELLWLGLGLYLALAVLTVGQRIAEARRVLL